MKEKIEKALGIDIDIFYETRKKVLLTAFRDNLASFNLNQKKIDLLNTLIGKVTDDKYFKLFLVQSKPLFWYNMNLLLKNNMSRAQIEKNINLIFLYLFDYCFAKKLINHIDFILNEGISFYFFSIDKCVLLPANTVINITEETNCFVIKINLSESSYPIKNSYDEEFYVINDPAIYFLGENNISKDINFSSDKLFFADNISQAFGKIQDLDKGMRADILKLCPLYFPIKLPAGLNEYNYSASFSLSELIGAIFLSKFSNVYWLCETLIHEYAHNLLHLIMLCDPLVNNYDKIYYSPWKNEPRHAHGLLHALFSFCLAITFMEKFIETELSYSDRDFIRGRLLNQSHRLNFGFQQQVKNGLNFNGKLIYDCIERHFMQSEASKFLQMPCPKEVRDHHENKKLKLIPSVG